MSYSFSLSICCCCNCHFPSASELIEIKRMLLAGVALLFADHLLTAVRGDDLINSYGSPSQMRNISKNYRVKSGLSILAKYFDG